MNYFYKITYEIVSAEDEKWIDGAYAVALAGPPLLPQVGESFYVEHRDEPDHHAKISGRVLSVRQEHRYERMHNQEERLLINFVLRIKRLSG